MLINLSRTFDEVYWGYYLISPIHYFTFALFFTIIIEVCIGYFFNKFYLNKKKRLFYLSLFSLIVTIWVLAYILWKNIYYFSTILLGLSFIFFVIFYRKINAFYKTIVLMNILTNLTLNSIIFVLSNSWGKSGGGDVGGTIIVLELLVFYVEYKILNYTLWNENDKSLFYTAIQDQKNFKLSWFMNFYSFFIGWIIYSIIILSSSINS
jgi:hypothetical protein